jgi:hypothetical protein
MVSLAGVVELSLAGVELSLAGVELSLARSDGEPDRISGEPAARAGPSPLDTGPTRSWQMRSSACPAVQPRPAPVRTRRHASPRVATRPRVGARDARLEDMRFMLAYLLLATAACGRSPEPRTPRPHSDGYAARMEHAEEHSRRAEHHRDVAKVADALPPSERYSCGDTALSDQSTSGGERLVPSVPCWDIAQETAAHRRYLAAREQQRADAERRVATRLVEDEIAACRSLPARELEHSPFSHRKEIASVIPHRETGKIRGVRVVFKPVPGLTVAWMRQAIACHRARFERLGEPPTYLTDDPTLVANATVSVGRRNGRIEVVVHSTDDASARIALDRAQDLVRERTAVR